MFKWQTRLSYLLLLSGLLVVISSHAWAATYEVGPGQALASVGEVPWATLQPGDTVRIHWRSTPYREKWVICRQGTAALPITVSGVPGPSGQRPVIDGENAVTAPGLNYWSESRGVIKIGGASTPPDLMPRHIIIENLEVRGGHSSHSFTNDTGGNESYGGNASGIYLEKGENVTIRNSTFHDNGNGLFVASVGSTVSRDILIQGNYIYGNGNSGSIFEHNSYNAAIGIVYEYNHFGPLRAGAGGNNLKDRSAGTVIRYNWIEGGNRQLDLVDGEDSSTLRNDPSYDETHVYGNVLIETAGSGNRQIVHYGGDSGATAGYRKGTLYFYNNTIVSTRTDRNTIFRLSTNDETADIRNNIFYTTLPGSDLSLVDETGVLNLSHNWIKTGWRTSFSSFQGTFNNDGTMVEGSSPGFENEGAQDFSLTAQSAALNAGTTLNATVLPTHNVIKQYVRHSSSETRPVAAPLDIGAFERSSTGNGVPCDISGDGSVTIVDVQLSVNQALGIDACTTADISNDGSCDIVDVQRFINTALGQACQIG